MMGSVVLFSGGLGVHSRIILRIMLPPEDANLLNIPVTYQNLLYSVSRSTRIKNNICMALNVRIIPKGGGAHEYL